MYGVHANEEIEWFVSSCIFLVMYHYYQIHCKMHNNINTHVHVRKQKCCLKISLSITSHAWNKHFRTISNRWELSIFTTMLPYISKKYFLIFRRFERKWRYIIFLISKFFEPWWKYIYIKFEKKFNKITHFLKTNS
jgi:hypothetical protein